MLRLSNLALPLKATEQDLCRLAAKRLGADPALIREMKLVKKSIDARDKGDVHYIYTVDVSLPQEDRYLKRAKDAMKAPQAAPFTVPQAAFETRPVVAGAGPAGLFAAWVLAKAGAKPILMERGKPVDERTRDVDVMLQKGQLDPESNIQFGEGGAGAFSDGKLTTGTKSPHQRVVLETFVECGAPEDILYLQKPHIGTDLLKGVVKNLRLEIIRLGGEVWHQCRLTGLLEKGGCLTGVTFEREGVKERIDCAALILATGHSARDTYQALFNQGLRMEAKPFAVGVRIEHPQELISRSQYGKFAPLLGAADYKLNTHTPDGRGVYTFCMCPGGVVVPAASQMGGVVTNGMSYHARDGRNANAALLVGVNPGDYGDDHPLAGLAWQRSLEKAAYRVGGRDFKAPCQRVEDLLLRRASKAIGSVLPTYQPGVTPAELDAFLPSFVTDNLRRAIPDMDKRLKGFAHPDALLTGVESRSSSPVRIVRDNQGQSSLQGVFPAGEGAGYAGGIVSAAADGIRCALWAIERSLQA